MPRGEVARTPAPLPPTVVALEAQQRSKKKITLIDHCYEVFRELYEKPEFRQYFNAGWNTQAVTGDVRIDRIKATLMAIDHAKRAGKVAITQAKEGAVHKAMNRAAWRLRLTIKDRRESANGQTTNGHGDENNQ